MNWKTARIAVLDTETTGLSVRDAHAWELGIVTVENGSIVHEACERFNPGITSLNPKITEITGITLPELQSYPAFATRAAAFKAHLESHTFYASYNVPFDRPFVEKLFGGAGLMLDERPWIDVLVMVKQFQMYEKGKKLEQAAKRLGITLNNAHNALADATCAAQILLHYADKPNLLPESAEEFLARLGTWDRAQAASYAAWKQRQQANKPEAPRGSST